MTALHAPILSLKLTPVLTHAAFVFSVSAAPSSVLVFLLYVLILLCLWIATAPPLAYVCALYWYPLLFSAPAAVALSLLFLSVPVLLLLVLCLHPCDYSSSSGLLLIF